MGSVVLLGVSPGLTSRPSLSAVRLVELVQPFARVAGINLSAFVERSTNAPTSKAASGCVAGINLSAFVERRSAERTPKAGWPVSPGLISRPSLSEAAGLRIERQHDGVSPGLTSRPSLRA